MPALSFSSPALTGMAFTVDLSGRTHPISNPFTQLSYASIVHNPPEVRRLGDFCNIGKRRRSKYQAHDGKRCVIRIFYDPPCVEGGVSGITNKAIRQERIILEGKVDVEGMEWALHNLGLLYADQGRLAALALVYITPSDLYRLHHRETAMIDVKEWTKTLPIVSCPGLSDSYSGD